MSFLKGKTKGERYEVIQECINLLENKNYSLRELGIKYNVSKQAISLALINYGYIPREKIKKMRINKKENNTENILIGKLNLAYSKINSLHVALADRRKRVKELEELINSNNIPYKEELEKLRIKYRSLLANNTYYKRKYKELKKLKKF